MEKAITFTKGSDGFAQLEVFLKKVLKVCPGFSKKGIIMRVREDQSGEHYSNVVSCPFYKDGVLPMMMESPICLVFLEGEGCIDSLLKTMGECTRSEDCSDGTFRKMFGNEKTRNVVHRSGCPDDGEKEYAMWSRFVEENKRIAVENGHNIISLSPLDDLHGWCLTVSRYLKRWSDDIIEFEL